MSLTFPRTDLLDKLQMVSPALASKPIVEELVHLWFTGSAIRAYNDEIGIEVPFKLDFTGGIRGETLIGVLGKSRAKNVEFIEDGEQLILKAANMRLELSTLPPERSLWEFPRFDTNRSIVLDKKFLDAVKRVLVSVGSDTSNAYQLGVTVLSSEDGGLDLYSTDSISLSWVQADTKRDVSVQRCVLPTAFCEQLRRLYDKTGGNLFITKDHAIAESTQGVKLFTRLIEDDRQPDFAASIDSNYSRDVNLIDLPTRFRLVLERAIVVLEGKQGETLEVFVEDDHLRVRATSAVGALTDAVELKGDHPDQSIKLNPELVKRVLEQSDKFALTSEAMILGGPGAFLHVIGSR